MREYDIKLCYVRLSMMKGIGPVTANRLLDLCGGIEVCFCMSYEEMIQKEADNRGNIDVSERQIKNFTSQRSNSESVDHAKQILREAEQKRISIITREDQEYPQRFLGIDEMPILLYVKGRLRVNSFDNVIGIVGARRCSKESKEKAIQIATERVADGCAVISGMAKGIDSYAHTATIKSDGYTVAVLGCGADICYPREHEKLYDAVIKNGCIVSEYPPGNSPRSYLFPRRNRLIAALSDELYVIDAGRHSGTESTVAFAEKYRRIVHMPLSL